MKTEKNKRKKKKREKRIWTGAAQSGPPGVAHLFPS
jgi:hypothetical protein